MEIKDFSKELRVRLIERVSSPLYSTFIISWCISNWRFFYVTLIETYASLGGTSKMQFILHVLYPWNCGCTYLKLIVIPVTSTWLIIWKLPALLDAAYTVQENHKNKRRVKRLDIIGAEKVDGVLLIKAMEEIKNKEKEYVNIAAEKKRIEDEIKELQFKVTESDKFIENRDKTIEKNRKDIVEKNNKLLRLEQQIYGFRHNLSDIFKGIWIRRSNQKEEWDTEYFYLQDNKYLCAAYENPQAYGEKYIIDQVIMDKKNGSYTFRKVPIHEGEPINVRLFQQSENEYKGTEDKTEVKYEFLR